MFYIYKITLLQGSLAGKYYYGKHKMRNGRKYPLTDGYFGSGTIIKDYFAKYGKVAGKTFLKEILEFNESEEENCRRERVIIGDKWQTDPMCINLKEGGIGGQYSEEARAKISKALKGYVHNEESRRHMSEAHKGKVPANKGRKMTEEQRLIISERRKGIRHTQEWKDNMSALLKGRKRGPMSEEAKQRLSERNKGKKRTKASKIKQGETLRGRKLSKEWCQHIGDGHRGITHTPEAIEKMIMAKKEKMRPVVQITPSGEMINYIGQAVAARKTGIPRMQIWRCINGLKDADSKGNKWVAA